MSLDDSLDNEWIFSIRVPSSAVSGGSSTGSQNNKSASQLLELRRKVEIPPRVRKSSPQDTVSSTTTISDLDHKSKTESNNKEVEFLLADSSTSSESQEPSLLGWVFSSPFWKLHSQFVLQVTYKPAWQAIPEYTQCHSCAAASNGHNGTMNSVLKALGSFCLSEAGCCSCVCQSSVADSYANTWTAADITQARLIDAFEVPGIGTCRAIRLTLTPLPLPEDFPRRIPKYLQSAYNSHLQRCGLGWSQSNAESQTASATIPPNLYRMGKVRAPTITFCLPLDPIDPPLLWKVQFPSVADHQDIAIQTYTVLDAKLSASPEPTHIYINGFQSWSFAGSIARGSEQPQPALPKTFSRAFNLGGSPPPPANVHVVSAAATSAVSSSSRDTSSFWKGSSSLNYWYRSDFFTCITANDGSSTAVSDPNTPESGTSRASSRDYIKHSSMQKLDETGGPALLLGWLAQREQFGVITSDRMLRHVSMHASADGAILLGDDDSENHFCASQQETDWAYAQLISPHSYDEEPMVHYLHAVAAHNQARPLQNGDLLTGWCSWYHYYNNITETNLLENFKMLAAIRGRVPMNAVVVDDGYMTAWGDWDSLKPGNFDGGMEKLARDISSNAMRPGLWLAPFTADKNAKITSPGNNPDWVICNDYGAPANSGNCGKFFYGLDATNPLVRKHAHEAVRRAVEDWKYNILKIDFLYAACLEGNGKYDLSLSRAQAMHLALSTIRHAAGPDVFLIGCGCPIATAIGYVDGMRISADTGPTWYPAPPLPWWDHGTLPSLRSMVRNSISRAPLGHRWWHNDPDCLLLGESTRLSDAEVASAASVVAMTCGMMLLSDDLTKVSLSRMRILSKIFPMTGSSAVVLDLHSANDGLPTLLRLWATDNHSLVLDELSNSDSNDQGPKRHNREATFFARKASFQLDEPLPPPNERKRSCIYAPKGLGSWTILSISNWSDKTAVLQVPPPALLPPPVTGFDESEADTFLDGHRLENVSDDDHGYHVLSFWSSKYSWLPPLSHANDQPLSKRLSPHETEIFHIKRVSPELPQYIGSDLHFSCCKEVRSFSATKTSVQITLKTDYNRVGHVFVFLPVINTSNVHVVVNGEPSRWVVVGNTPSSRNGSPRLVGKVIRVMVVVHAGGQAEDGKISIEY